MFAKRFACGFLAMLLIALCGGCRPSASSTDKPSTNQLSTIHSQPSTPPVLSLHWLGINQIAADTNRSASFMLLWNLPETVKLKDQTLDKLARFFSTNGLSTLNHPLSTNQLSTSAVRPLLDDLVQSEWYFEMPQAPTNGAANFSLAVRLSDERAALWQTNLSPLLNPNLSISRSNGWTLLASSASVSSPATRHSSPVTNAWLEANFDLNRLASPELKSLLTSPQTPSLPMVSLTVANDGGALRTRGLLTFDKPLPIRLEPWNIPTNLISSPFLSFSAVRGIQPWLGASKLWTDLQVGTPPNQFYFWALQSSLTQSYFAAPHPDASNEVAKIADLVLSKCGPGSPVSEQLRFARSQSYNGLEWRGLPMFAPFLRSFSINGADFIFGGSAPVQGSSPLPPELLNELAKGTNLVAYSSEITGPRVEQLILFTQFFRLAYHRAQLPGDSAGMVWLKSLMPRLDNSVSAIIQAAPDQLAFTRVSRIGMTALELHLLADWLESTSFPSGIHSSSVAVSE